MNTPKTIEELKKEIFEDDFGDKADIREYAYSDICSFIDHAFNLGAESRTPKCESIEELKKEPSKIISELFNNVEFTQDFNNKANNAFASLIDHAVQIEQQRIIGVIESRIKLCEDLETYRGCSPKMQADFSAKKTELISLKSILSTPTQEVEEQICSNCLNYEECQQHFFINIEKESCRHPFRTFASKKSTPTQNSEKEGKKEQSTETTDSLTYPEILSRISDVEKAEKAINRFAFQMFLKIKKKANEGWTGWDDEQYKNNILNGFIKKSEQIKNGDLSQCVDAANFCMMLDRFFSLSTPPAEKECEWVATKDREGFEYKTQCGHYRYRVPKNNICNSGNPECGKLIKINDKEK